MVPTGWGLVSPVLRSVGAKGTPKWAPKDKMVKSLQLGVRLSDMAAILHDHTNKDPQMIKGVIVGTEK